MNIIYYKIVILSVSQRNSRKSRFKTSELALHKKTGLTFSKA